MFDYKKKSGRACNVCFIHTFVLYHSIHNQIEGKKKFPFAYHYNEKSNAKYFLVAYLQRCKKYDTLKKKKLIYLARIEKARKMLLIPYEVMCCSCISMHVSNNNIFCIDLNESIFVLRYSSDLKQISN